MGAQLKMSYKMFIFNDSTMLFVAKVLYTQTDNGTFKYKVAVFDL